MKPENKDLYQQLHHLTRMTAALLASEGLNYNFETEEFTELEEEEEEEKQTKTKAELEE